LETECEQIGFAKEKRNFKPHLTIARLREPQKSIELVRTHTAKEFTAINFNVGKLIVFQSELHPHGSRYTPIFHRDFS
jgi:2'-5' RNA ligase